MAHADSPQWVAWTRSPGGIATRVALGVLGCGLALLLLVVSLFVLPLLGSMIAGGSGMFFSPSLLGLFAGAGVAVGITTLTAAILPRRVLMTVAAVMLLGGIVLVIVVMSGLGL